LIFDLRFLIEQVRGIKNRKSKIKNTR
jgi:hypothetical protein